MAAAACSDLPTVALSVPAQLDVGFCKELAAALEAASRRLPAQLPATLPHAACLALLKRCTRLLKAEPTLLQVAPPAGSEVVVVGDLHGHYHDLLTMFSLVGFPSSERVFVFDGDFVDRGAWGLEIVVLLAALKAALPKHMVLLRGNHESVYCSWVYGFRREVLAKYGPSEGTAVYNACKQLFQHLPLAAVVAGNTLVVHGGLPRAPPRRRTRRSLPAEGDSEAPAVATLADIAASGKGGEDPDPAQDEQRLAADMLWSDPSSQPGIQLGARPGDVGILFGPDATQAFLRDNGLTFILRGHEGPDARSQRDDMPDMQQGHTLDHDTPAGQLHTVFSAPDYPQFGQQHGNLGAVAVLAAPCYAVPRFVTFEAAPRPEATAYYTLESEQEEEGLADLEEPGGTAGTAHTAGGAAGTGALADTAGAGACRLVAAVSEEASSDVDEVGPVVRLPSSLDASLDQESGSSHEEAAETVAVPAPATADSDAAAEVQQAEGDAIGPSDSQLKQPAPLPTGGGSSAGRAPGNSSDGEDKTAPAAKRQRQRSSNM